MWFMARVFHPGEDDGAVLEGTASVVRTSWACSHAVRDWGDGTVSTARPSWMRTVFTKARARVPGSAGDSVTLRLARVDLTSKMPFCYGTAQITIISN